MRLFSDPETESPVWLRSPRVRLGAVVVTMILVLTAALSAWRSREGVPVSHHFPAGAVSFLEENSIVTRPFNHQNYGGYLGWELQEPIFWDGRNLLFASLMTEVAQMPLVEVEERWEIDSLLLTEFEYRQMREQILPTEWSLVYWDDFSALFLRRSPAKEEVIERSRLETFPPFGGVERLQTMVQDPVWTRRARGELDQILSFEPRCQRALYFHGLISLYQGDLARAEVELRRALELGPNPYVEKALSRSQGSAGSAREPNRG